MTATARLGLPLLQPAQAQKHVTHNEALARLDLLTQLVVEATGAGIPPAAPVEGEIHALGAAPSGAWVGQAEGSLAAWLSGGWTFLVPAPGWRAWDKATGTARVWTGAAWAETGASDVAAFGIGTAADPENPLSVAAATSLFTVAAGGADHRLKVNCAAGGTAALLFQRDYSGRAEIGLAGGGQDLSIKVSPDGSAFREALRADRQSGIVSLPRGFDGVQVVVPYEQAVAVETPSAGGFVLVSVVDAAFPQNQASAILVYDTGRSPLLTTVWAGAGIDNLGTVPLSGTTGAGGQLSIAADGDGRLQVENRFAGGVARQVALTFLNGFRQI